jgi:hypothetical protein
MDNQMALVLMKLPIWQLDYQIGETLFGCSELWELLELLAITKIACVTKSKENNFHEIRLPHGKKNDIASAVYMKMLCCSKQLQVRKGL